MASSGADLRRIQTTLHQKYGAHKSDSTECGSYFIAQTLGWV